MRPEDLIVRHSIRGRLRIKVTFLHLHVESAAQLGQLLAGQAGVKSAEVRPITGSVILCYDPERLPPMRLSNYSRRFSKHPCELLRTARQKKPPRELSITTPSSETSYTLLPLPSTRHML